MVLAGIACSSKDNGLRAGDGAIDQPAAGTGGTKLGTGGAGGSLGGSGGSTSPGTGGSTSGTGGAVTGTGGSGAGGVVVGTGGRGAGGIVTGTGGTVQGTGGSGKGGSGSGGAFSTGGTSGTGGAGGQGGTGQGGTALIDAGTDAADAAAQPNCPSAVPSGSCSVSTSTMCYYGTDPRWFCKTSAKCSQGTWQLTQPMAECTATPDPSCPADPASAPASICSADGGTKATCVYPTKFCKCGFTGGSAPGWVCSVTLPAECPALPPGDGSPCTMTSGSLCTYGLSCSSSKTVQCIEDKWVTLLLVC
jgi:hypothetical protein